MKISAINNNPAFKANLSYKGEQIPYDSKRHNNGDISEYGAKNTNINITGFSTKKAGYDTDCYINFTLTNPVFGEKTFKNVQIHTDGEQNRISSEAEKKSALYNFFTSSAGIMLKFYENLTMKHTLLTTMNQNAKENARRNNTDFETDAGMILYDILSDTNKEDEGLSEERIEELNNIAEKVNTDVVLKGTTALLNKQGNSL